MTNLPHCSSLIFGFITPFYYCLYDSFFRQKAKEYAKEYNKNWNQKISKETNKKGKKTWKNTWINIQKSIPKFIWGRQTKKEKIQKRLYQNISEEDKQKKKK